jgi:hypothetical protein
MKRSTVSRLALVCAALCLSCSTRNENEQDVEIPIVVAKGAPVMDLLPEVVAFSPVAPGETRSHSVRLMNTGTADLELRGFTFSGHPDFRFVYTSPGASEATIVAPTGNYIVFDPLIVVPPGESRDVIVSFAPTAPGPADGSLAFVTNEVLAVNTITLRANPQGACIAVSPLSVQFAARPVGEQAVLPVEMASCGDEPLEITGIAVTNNPSGNFTLDFANLPSGATPHTATPLSLPAHTTATFNVVYEIHHVSPITNGQPEYDVGTIIISSNAPGSAVTLDLSAYGTDVPCPTAVGSLSEGAQVSPQTTLHLFSDASAAPDGGVPKRLWTVTQPPGSDALFVPSATFPNPTFEANVVGTYTFRLDVWDGFDTKSCVPWEGTVVVVPE